MNRKFSAALAAAMLLALSLPAHGQRVRLEIEGGNCEAQKSEEGTWWQKGFAHSFQLKDRCGSARLSFATPMKDVRLVAGYASLGQFATSADANADDNDDKSRRGMISADPRRPECAEKLDDTRLRADCHFNWKGSGGVQGLLAGIQWEPLKLGPVHIGAEAGMFFYKAHWREVIRPIDCPANQCWELQVDQRTGWQLGPEFGLTARWEYVYLAARRYELRMPSGKGNPNEPTQAPGITTGFRAPIHQFVVGVIIPL